MNTNKEFILIIGGSGSIGLACAKMLAKKADKKGKSKPIKKARKE